MAYRRCYYRTANRRRRLRPPSKAKTRRRLPVCMGIADLDAFDDDPLYPMIPTRGANRNKRMPQSSALDIISQMYTKPYTPDDAFDEQTAVNPCCISKNGSF